MPIRVPVRRVAEEPLPGARLSPGTPDAGAFEAGVITQLGSQIADVGASALGREERIEKATAAKDAKILKAQTEFKGRRDKLRATNAINGFKDIWRNQRETYVNKFGLDADGQASIADKDLEGYSKSLSDNAENDEQRALIAAKFAAFRETELNIIKGHEVDQFKISEDAENKANTANIMREARVGHNDPITLFRLKLDLEDAIGEEVRGKGPEESEQITSTMTSLFHESVLNEKIPFNAENAQEYYDEHKTDILPEEREGIETLLKKEDTLQFAQQESDRIVATERDRSKWVTEAEKIKDPEKRKATVDHVKVKKRELDQLDKEAVIALNNTRTDRILDAPDLTSALSVADEATGTERVKLRGVANGRWKEKTAAIVTDPVLEEKLNGMVTRGEIKTSQHYIRETGGKMSNPDLQKNLKFLRQGGEVGNIQEGSLRSKFTEIMNLQPKEDPFLYKLARDYIVDQVQATGKPPTPTNIDQWMGEALLSGTETESEGGFFGFFAEERPVTLVEALERRVTFTADISEDEVKNIVSDIDKHNATVPIENRILKNADTIEIIFLRDEGFTDEEIREIRGK